MELTPEFLLRIFTTFALVLAFGVTAFSIVFVIVYKSFFLYFLSSLFWFIAGLGTLVQDSMIQTVILFVVAFVMWQLGILGYLLNAIYKLQADVQRLKDATNK